MLFQRRAKLTPKSLSAERLTRTPNVVSTTEREYTVLLDVVSGRYHTLNGVGARVWEMLADGTTVDAIVRAIREEYELPADVPPDQVERDVTTLLCSLDAAGLVRTSSSDRGTRQ